ncbi:hypothetical protein IIC38_14495 [candidate division KSB1 bacterium]|nr:hypothetical protein [candidate division KSB1 bacterium]
MRIENIYKGLKQIDFTGSLLTYEHVSGVTKKRKLGNVTKFKTIINEIDDLNIFKDAINILYKTDLYTYAGDSFSVDLDSFNKFWPFVLKIFNGAIGLLEILDNIVVNPKAHSILIKLPDKNDFSQLVNNMASINKSLEQLVLHDDIKGKIVITNWHYSSFWIELMLGSQAALVLLGSIAWSSSVIYKKLNEAMIIGQHVKSLKIKNDSLEDIKQGQKILIEQLLELESKNVLKKHYPNGDNEQTERIKLSIKSFAKLIQQGSEIHPALNAPEDVANLFPDFKQLDSVESKVKKLKDKN